MTLRLMDPRWEWAMLFCQELWRRVWAIISFHRYVLYICEYCRLEDTGVGEESSCLIFTTKSTARVMLGSISFEMSMVREPGLPGPLGTEPEDQVQAVTIWPSWGDTEVWLPFWIRAINVDRWLQIQFLWGVKSKMFLKEVNADIAYLSIIYILYIYIVYIPVPQVAKMYHRMCHWWIQGSFIHPQPQPV